MSMRAVLRRIYRHRLAQFVTAELIYISAAPFMDTGSHLRVYFTINIFFSLTVCVQVFPFGRDMVPFSFNNTIRAACFL